MEQELQGTSIKMPAPMLDDLRQEAREKDVSLSRLIREYVRQGRGHASTFDLRRETSDGNR